MYYKFKIILYETVEILESSRFYAKRGNARRYLPRYCYSYVKLHGAAKGKYSIEIKSESGWTLFAVAKLGDNLYDVWRRKGWREDALIWGKVSNSIPEELEMKTYYILKDMGGYGSEYPICIDRKEAERLTREWNKEDFDEIWREASDEEIAKFGRYDTDEDR